MSWVKEIRDISDKIKSVCEERKGYTSYVSDEEYQEIRKASMRGLITADFERDALNGEVTFYTDDPRKLARQLEKVIDFGATSANDVFGLPPTY